MTESESKFAPDVFLDSPLQDVQEDIFCSGERFQIIRPGDTDQLIEVAAERHQFETTRYMPYWANIWPVSRYLASFLLTMDWHGKKERVLELGCGLGLSGLAALRCGHHVTFSDYDLAALRYAKRNAELNQFHEFDVMPLNWQYPGAQRFSLLIGSDLTFTASLVPDLVQVFDQMLERNGRIILADQNRMNQNSFSKLLAAKGFSYEVLAFPIPEEWAWNASGSLYEIRR